jgi:3,4-dihydroxy 2-butanone 4-phosphate synthase/GTP cyclohydrolase II
VSAVPDNNGSLEAALGQLRRGGMVVVCDDPDRENEGDLCMAAQFVTAEKIAFMAREARGLICLSLPPERCDALDLPLMVPANAGCDATGFCISIEAATGVTTGISAADRARTIQVAVDPASRPSDLVRPGHVFPLRARPRGVLERRGQTEAAVDLTRLAGLTPGGVLCEVMNPDGTMACGVQLQAFCRRHELPIITVEEIATHLRDRQPAISAV